MIPVPIGVMVHSPAAFSRAYQPVAECTGATDNRFNYTGCIYSPHGMLKPGRILMLLTPHQLVCLADPARNESSGPGSLCCSTGRANTWNVLLVRSVVLVCFSSHSSISSPAPGRDNMNITQVNHVQRSVTRSIFFAIIHVRTVYFFNTIPR